MQTRFPMSFSVIGSKVKWPSSTILRSLNSKVVSVKKDSVSTSLAWVNHSALNVTPTPFKRISLAQTAYFLPESQVLSPRVSTVDSEITPNKTATNASLKNITQKKPINLRRAAAAAAEAVMAEGEGGAEAVEVAEADVEAETIRKLIWLMLTLPVPPPTPQFSVVLRTASKQQQMHV